MTEVGGVAADRLKSFIERIERLEEEKAAMAADIREIVAECKASGFHIPTVKQILRLRKIDQSDRREQEAILDLYKRAMDMD